MKEEVMALLVRTIVDIRPALAEQSIQCTDSMVDLGINSMERAEIIMSVLDELNLNIALIETFGPRNLEELAQLLVSRKNAA